MDTHAFDTLVIGAGIAGATAAAHIAPDRRVALIEAEETAGYHTTGRSAAMWIQNYGPPDIRLLTGLSRAFFETPPAGFTDTPLMSRRPVVIVATPDKAARIDEILASGNGIAEFPLADLTALIPALRPGHIARATIEADAFDMDVAALHQGFLRALRTHGGTLALRNRAGRIAREAGLWRVETSTGDIFTAPILVNSAGAWGDEIGQAAGLTPRGLVPKRRTAAIVDPAPYNVAAWPLLVEVDDEWYCRPEARTRLLCSPADETPDRPHDVQPDELDIAIAIDRVQQALDLNIRRVEHAWAGLRTFTPDGSLALGWDETEPTFLWCVGQGGYGIQTSPAAGRLAADIVAGRDPGKAGSILQRIDPRRFAA